MHIREEQCFVKIKFKNKTFYNLLVNLSTLKPFEDINSYYLINYQNSNDEGLSGNFVITIPNFLILKATFEK